jgi:hypothetical protein
VDGGDDDHDADFDEVDADDRKILSNGRQRVGGVVELMAQRGVALAKASRRPRPVGVGEMFIHMAAALLRKQVVAMIAEVNGVHAPASGGGGGAGERSPPHRVAARAGRLIW